MTGEPRPLYRMCKTHDALKLEREKQKKARQLMAWMPISSGLGSRKTKRWASSPISVLFSMIADELAQALLRGTDSQSTTAVAAD